MDSKTTPCFKILMFPWLAHGHIFPYLELSQRILARKNFHINFCSTAINFNSIKNFIQAHNLDASIELVELHLEPSPHLPPHYYTTKNLPLHLNPTLIKAFQTAKPSFIEIVTNLNPDLIIYDTFQPWAPKFASSQGIPAVHFSVVGAASVTNGHNHYKVCDDNFPFTELHCEDYENKSLDEVNEFVCANVFEGDRDTFYVNYILSSEFVLIKTSSGFEGKYLDYFSGICDRKLLPVGSLITDPSDGEDCEVLQWLSKKPHHSTVYISFGSEHFMSREEIEEMAKGLELCEVNFIWVLRFPLGKDTNTSTNTIAIEEALPEGFLKRVQERGVVVSGWAPQAKILKHPSTGAFVSHCGWSSIMESMYFGVPIIGMPLKINMFTDANMLVGAGAGMKVPRKENEGYKGEDIAKVINEVFWGEKGDKLRLKAREFSEKMRMEEGKEMDVAAEKLWQLCLKKNKLKVQDS